MNSRSIAEEIEDINRKRRPWRTAAITTLAVLLLGSGVLAAASSHGDTSDVSSVSDSVTDPASTTPSVSTTPAPQPAAPQPIVITQAPAVPSAAETDAKLCKGIIDNAQDIAKSNNKMYFDAWNGWLQNYRDMYDTQEAQDSKQFYKSHIQKLYADLIAQNDPSMQRACHSSGSLADILVQPDYNAW